MAQTLVNVNQNQLNNQNGSYVELIKNTQQAKEGLAQALVNKGANVSSSSTFADMITAVNNLATISGSFTAIKGTYISGSSYIDWSRESDRATYIIVNDKGVFAFHIIDATTLRVASLNGYDYNSNSSALLTTTLAIDASGYITNTSVASYYRRFFMNTDGSKLWCISADGTKINEYTLDYSGVSSENPVNVSITLSQSLVMDSSLNNLANASAVLAVNESKKKILIFDPAALSTSQISITANCYIIDYNNGITGLTKETVSGDIGKISTSVAFTNFPLNMTENVLYQQYTASFVDIIWDENKLEIHTQITTGLIGIPAVLQFNNQRFISYTEGSIDATYNNQFNVRLLDLDTYSIIEKTFLSFCAWNTSGQYSTKDFCLPQKVGDKIFLTGFSIGTLVELKIENSEVVINPIPSLTQKYFSAGNFHSNVGQLLYDGNNGFCSFRFTNGNSKMWFQYFSGTMNKLISYMYNDENNNHIAFTPYNNSAFTNYLDFPQPEVLVEDN